MATPVYSTLFVSARGTSINTGYVVPAGHVAVVRDIAVLFDGSPTNTACQVLGETGGGLIFYRLALDPYEYDHWVGHQVVDAGSEIQVLSSGSQDVFVRVSGYLLTAP